MKHFACWPPRLLAFMLFCSKNKSDFVIRFNISRWRNSTWNKFAYNLQIHEFIWAPINTQFPEPDCNQFYSRERNNTYLATVPIWQYNRWERHAPANDLFESHFCVIYHSIHAKYVIYDFRGFENPLDLPVWRIFTSKLLHHVLLAIQQTTI